MARDTELISQCLPLVNHVEHLLHDYYGATATIRAADFVQIGSENIDQLGDHATELDRHALSSRGHVTALVQDDETYMAIGFSEEVLRRLTEANPLRGLHNSNLDALCVLIEEISHFHMLAQAIAAGVQVTRLALEVQGEIDKLLVTALMAHAQYGHPHILPLARLIFDAATVDATSYIGYQRAHRLAAKTWFEIIRSAGDTPQTLRQQGVRGELCRLHRLHSQAKVEAHSGQISRVV